MSELVANKAKSDNCTVFAPPQYMRPFLGKDGYAKRMNFRKSAKGEGVIFNPKIYVADFGNFKQVFLSDPSLIIGYACQ